MCPTELRYARGCNLPCSVFKNDQLCCSINSTASSCRRTTYSKFFNDLCSDAYFYPFDNATSLFTGPSGIDYKVVFCPWSLTICIFLFSFLLFLSSFFLGGRGLSYSFFQLHRQLFISAPLANRNKVPLSHKYRSKSFLFEHIEPLCSFFSLMF